MIYIYVITVYGSEFRIANDDLSDASHTFGDMSSVVHHQTQDSNNNNNNNSNNKQDRIITGLTATADSSDFCANKLFWLMAINTTHIADSDSNVVKLGTVHIYIVSVLQIRTLTTS